MKLGYVVATITILTGGGALVKLFNSRKDPSDALTIKKSRPNFVVFFADDIGWGDLGANWKPNEIVTPNLNKMAERGMRFTDFHAGASVCAPSRAALLTGRLGLRTGLVENFAPGSVGGLPVNETIIPEVLRSYGYQTGMIGKWHLGTTKLYHPNARGFDFYYGLPYSNDMGCVDVPVYNHPPEKPCPKNSGSNTAVPLYENTEIVEQPVDLINLGDHYAEKAEEFLSLAAQNENPFFLYVAFAHMHVPLAHAPRFSNSTDVNTVYSDTLHEMDDVIGRILDSLKKHAMDDNTMLWFTGDNGPWLGKCMYSGNSGPFLGTWLTQTYGGGSTAKCTTWEAGHREPTVVVWPGQVSPNTTSSALTSALDIFPTILKSAGAELPRWRRFDGKDISDLLEGRKTDAHEVLFHPNSGVTGVIGEIDTIRIGPYKVFWKTGGSGGCCFSCDGRVAPLVAHDPPLVFNVEKDPAESTLITPGTDPDYHYIINSAIELRENILADIKTDNTSVPDYRRADWAYPCCDKNQFLCRCKKDRMNDQEHAVRII